MTIIVNGEQQTFDIESITVERLIKINNVKNPDMVSVQLNGNFVKRELFSETLLHENDEIDFLYYMGGGKY